MNSLSVSLALLKLKNARQRAPLDTEERRGVPVNERTHLRAWHLANIALREERKARCIVRSLKRLK